jgi:Na+/alanine symporter
MAIPNLMGLLLLSGIVVRETRSYFSRYPVVERSGRPPR